MIGLSFVVKGNGVRHALLDRRQKAEEHRAKRRHEQEERRWDRLKRRQKERDDWLDFCKQFI